MLVEHCMYYKMEVTATTGTAASLINGMTVHAMFELWEGMRHPFIEPGTAK